MDNSDDETTDGTIIGSLSRAAASSQPSTSGGNVYTPLLAPARSPKTYSSSADSSTRNTKQASKDEILKPAPVALTKQVSKPTLELQPQPHRGQRSSVRPFFCCGSELSLVSLVDGLDLKNGCPTDKKVSSLECNSSSDEEDYASQNNLSRKGSSSHAAYYSGESRHAIMRRKKKEKHSAKKKSWSSHFRGHWNSRLRVSQPQHSANHRYDLSHLGSSGTYQKAGSPGLGQRSPRLRPMSSSNQIIDLSRLQDFDQLYPVDDIDTIQMRERAEEMKLGVDVDPVSLTRAYRPPQPVSNSMFDFVMWQWQGSRSSSVDGAMAGSPRIHTQVDFIHCLVPQLVKILSCPFYWGVMDRYEAERLLDNKPEGTFLLRDSAQEDFLFSVSFRRYNRSLHARVEQWNHRFSFDAHDPAVFSAPSVCELMEHYKDPCCCMFFEPMLTRPLPRNFPFSLQHICRAVICDRLVYDQIRCLPIPNSLKQFLQVYHYKQKVRVRRFDGPETSLTD